VAVSSVSETLDLAVRLARAAGGVQRERYETALSIGTKSAPVDLVTEVDRRCEELIVETLVRERGGDAILAEEGSRRDATSGDWRWVIDPLDGTVNYAHGYPRFCVSIGVEHRGLRSVGVVYDPLLDELYHATAGGGAFRNGRPIRTSTESEIGRGLFATGFAYDVHRSENDNLDHFARFVKTARAVRRDGSAALDLCYVASGRLDGYWELKLHAWDVAAGALIVEEAGGRTSDLAGGPLPADGASVVASNGALHDAMLRLLANCAPDSPPRSPGIG
jgi:myo-inositol-1(or 4)-monophosphatase